MGEMYYIEVTDTFIGEANYSWVTRHVINANSMRGAVQRFSHMSGMSWHCTSDYGDQRRYDSKSGATCYFIEPYDESAHGKYRFDTDER
jgi:hypothetical protein